MNTITPKALKTIIGYQKLCKKDAPVTMRATFRLSFLEDLIKTIKACPEFEKDGSLTHNICVTFVREKIKGDNQLNTQYTGISSQGLSLKNSIQKPAGYYTQLIPIISGCVSSLDNNLKNSRFKFLRDAKGNIPFIRPGGEGTGLIPPPPTGSDDNLS